jgi:hypothetical protein
MTRTDRRTTVHTGGGKADAFGWFGHLGGGGVVRFLRVAWCRLSRGRCWLACSRAVARFSRHSHPSRST